GKVGFGRVHGVRPLTSTYITTEAAKHVLTTSVTARRDRVLDVNSLATATERRFWKGHFHITNAKVELGTPLVSVLGDWDSHKHQATVGETAAALEHSLTREELAWLTTQVADCYWRGTFQRLDGLQIRRFNEYGI